MNRILATIMVMLAALTSNIAANAAPADGRVCGTSIEQTTGHFCVGDTPDPNCDNFAASGGQICRHADNSGWIIVCTNRAGIVIAGKHDGSGSVFHELSSETMCDGYPTGILGIPTTMKIDAQYDPRLRATMIRFEDDLGQSSFRVGICELTEGNLAVFVTASDGNMAVVILYVPALCSS